MRYSSLTSKEKFRLWFNTLFYNTCMSWSYAMDVAIEPLFYLVDHFTTYIGRMFVVAVFILISLVVVIAHLLGIPIYSETSPTLTFGFLLPTGYWILMNLAFNFIQGVRVSPGLPTNSKLMSTVTICKKCISPKPQRTHHCSICNVCYLKMDHHCPWLNNCIGHFNHRYFYLSMVYIVAGCVFLIIFGVSIAYHQLILDIDVLPFVYEDYEKDHEEKPQIAPDFSNSVMDSLPIGLKALASYFISKSVPQLADRRANGQGKLLFGIPASKSLVVAMLYFMAVLCIGATIALGALIIWHGKLISRGETSIEYHINKAQRKKLEDKFVNPYNRGRRRNWELFFGLDQPGITIWKNLLLPSAHSPSGNGYDWSHS